MDQAATAVNDGPTAAEGAPFHIGSVATLLGFVLLICVPAYLLIDSNNYYRGLAGYLEFGYNHPFVFGLSLLLLAMVWGWLGTSLGIQNLFWDDGPGARGAAAFAVTLYFALLGTLAFFEQVLIVWHTSPSSSLNSPATDPLGEIAEDNHNSIDDPQVSGRNVGRRVFLPQASNLEVFLLITGLPLLALILAPAALPRHFPDLPRRAAPPGVGPVVTWLKGFVPSLVGALLGVALVYLVIQALRPLSPKLMPAIEAMVRGQGGDGSKRMGFEILGVELLAMIRFSLAFVVIYAVLSTIAYPRVTPAMAVCAIIALVVLTLTLPTFLIRLIDAQGVAFRRICQFALAVVAVVVPWLITTTSAKARGTTIAAAPAQAIKMSAIAVIALWTGYELLERAGHWLPEHRQTLWFLIFWGGLAAWLVLANGDAYKLRFPHLDHYYPGGTPGLVHLREAVEAIYQPVAVREETPPPGASGGGNTVRLLADAEVLPRWRARFDPATKPKLAVVTVSGGALRSAYWTSVVLGRIGEEIPDFADHLRVIAGASGGMLGAAYFVCDRRARHHPDAPPIPPMPVASIAAVARHIALREMWFGFLPRAALEAARNHLGLGMHDRGVILERDWHGIDVPFRDLMSDEADGSIPSLIFSPMIVEDGRRLLISNLDLKGITRTSGPAITGELSGSAEETYSLTALEFFRLFPQADAFRLATMVRMSASFPFVSPAVNLPTIPPRRIVDAGYYDNYGVQIAASWIHANLEWLAENTSGVTLIQIRDEMSREDRLEVVDAPAGLGARLARGMEFLTSPVHAIAKARAASNAFRNDEDVEILCDLFASSLAGRVANPQAFFMPVTFENSAKVANGPGTAEAWPGDDRQGLHRGGSVALNWYLSRAERQGLEAAIPRPTPGSRWLHDDARFERIRELQAAADRSSGLVRLVRFKELERALNYERLQQLKRWWTPS